jgi:hypothetical protein
MRISQTFASKYMKAGDLADGEMLATIDRVVEEEVGKDKQVKPVLYLNGQQKGIVLNRTNAERLAHKLGDDTLEWRGKSIEIYSELVSFQGQKVEGLRVRIPRRAEVAQTLNDDIPF